MNTDRRMTAREIARKYLDAGKPLGWFEALYSKAIDDFSLIPWADMMPNPNLVDWLDLNYAACSNPALKVGNGLGDDAEELAKRGFDTTAFDISTTAIAQSRARFPQSSVSYVVADLFAAPREWNRKFGFVLESYTLQVLPAELRAKAIRCIASFVAPGGILLVIARGRESDEPEGTMPWPLLKEELALFKTHGLKEMSFEDYFDEEQPPIRRFRATFCRN